MASVTLRRQELASAVVGEGLRPLLLPDLSAALQTLLAACWAADPSQRPTFTQAVVELRRMQVGK